MFLWWLNSDTRHLTAKAKRMIGSQRNTVFVSAVSAWEPMIKKRTHNMRIPEDLREAIDKSGFQTLAITVEHAVFAGELPLHHADPFDRMLIAQAAVEGLTLMTHDKEIAEYKFPAIVV